MPRYSVWLVRLALLYLVLGFTLGALMLAREGAGWPPPAFEALRPLHAEVLLVGWMLQLAFGVANWILPFGRGHTERPLLLVVIGLLNGGVWLAGLSPLIFGSPLLQAAGRAAEAGAVLIFAVHIWPRLRALPQHARKRRRQRQ